MPGKVYQMVNGQRVPKPGNERDPARRYSCCFEPETGERYYVEFTPEQEAARDAEEAKWECERPQREAEKLALTKEEEAFRDGLKYEDRVVAFLDILGWRKAIDKSLEDNEFTKKLGLATRFINVQAYFSSDVRAFFNGRTPPGDLHMTQFSDCIVLSTTADMCGIDSIVRTLDTTCRYMLELGLLIRGAITKGKILHREQMCYGPALIAAYELESTTAYYPRIILTEELSKELVKGRMYTKDGVILGYDKTWRKCSFDGKWFFDYLQPFMAKTFCEVKQGMVRFHLECARKVAITGLEAGKSRPDIYSKYVWFAKYLNEVIAEYPVAEVEPVII